MKLVSSFPLLILTILQLLTEKDKVIENQRTDLTNLRKKNFEFRSKIQELEDAKKDDRRAGRRQGQNEGGNDRVD